MARVLNEDEITLAICMFDEGIRVVDIARKLHCRNKTVSDVLKEHGRKLVQGRSQNRLLRSWYFENIDSELKAYFLGLLFTDGSVVCDMQDNRSPRVSLELVETDVEVLYMLMDELGVLSSLRYNKRANRKNGTFTMMVRSTELAESLSKYGIVQNKTYITNTLPNIPEEYLPQFVHGLIDGDGSIYYSKNAWHINFCSHSKRICEQFEHICSSLICKEKHMKIQCSNGVYRVTYNGEWACKLAKVCYDGINYGIARKRLLAMKTCEDKTVEDIV